MSAIPSSVDTQNTLNSGRINQALKSDEFMQLLITELTNQDPFEPMKNQDLIDQISSIQALESNQNMSDSFSNLMDRLDTFVSQFDGLLNREQLSTAGKLIGQLVSGLNADGDAVFGKVNSISVDDGVVNLELDNGETVSMDQLTRLGGTIDSIKASDMVGQVVIGASQGRQIIGTVESVEIDESEVILNIDETGGSSNSTVSVPLSSATAINETTADLMIGLNVDGNNGSAVSGVVDSFKIDSEGIKLILTNPSVADKIILPLKGVTSINPSSSL